MRDEFTDDMLYAMVLVGAIQCRNNGRELRAGRAECQI